MPAFVNPAVFVPRRDYPSGTTPPLKLPLISSTVPLPETHSFAKTPRQAITTSQRATQEPATHSPVLAQQADIACKYPTGSRVVFGKAIRRDGRVGMGREGQCWPGPGEYDMNITPLVSPRAVIRFGRSCRFEWEEGQGREGSQHGERRQQRPEPLSYDPLTAWARVCAPGVPAYGPLRNRERRMPSSETEGPGPAAYVTDSQQTKRMTEPQALFQPSFRFARSSRLDSTAARLAAGQGSGPHAGPGSYSVPSTFRSSDFTPSVRVPRGRTRAQAGWSLYSRRPLPPLHHHHHPDASSLPGPCTARQYTTF
ncbi:unnamed protein product [Vitrella brassicaformis CCMP3155]|uniref:Uncharacterized protein n=1 Tax=Vitrella brassicaformis (strain CCMP3155) TaxID=1169540 RepID=A0A0G4EYF0_VITBC|nr:unnamed protein product [Vitrella brassicaformis CCMP3155]|eukprot:CEM04170.1 unnamed protein product [Vitrella brassicaformis CCMP3155]